MTIPPNFDVRLSKFRGELGPRDFGSLSPDEVEKTISRQHRTKIVRQLRQQIIRQIVQKRRRNTGVFQGVFCNITEKMQANAVQSAERGLCAVLPQVFETESGGKRSGIQPAFRLGNHCAVLPL